MPRFSASCCFAAFSSSKKSALAKRASALALLAALTLVCGISPALADNSGLDTPHTVLSLPLQVAGVKVMELDVPYVGATSGTVTFTGPITEGATTIKTDGTITEGGTTIATDGTVTVGSTVNSPNGSELNVVGGLSTGVMTSGGFYPNAWINSAGEANFANGLVWIDQTGEMKIGGKTTPTAWINNAGQAYFNSTVTVGGDLSVANTTNTSQLCLNGTCLKRAIPIQGDFLVVVALANGGNNWYDNESSTTAAVHDMCIMTAVQHDGMDSNCNLDGSPGAQWTVSAQSGIKGSGQAGETNCAMKCYDWR